jgi:cytidyltransferase-like protein
MGRPWVDAHDLGHYLRKWREDRQGCRVVLTSGYFNPLHCGHLDYLKDARRYGDKLVVVVNSDLQVALKGSRPFMTQVERLRIVASLEYVQDAVVDELDTDRTICRMIQLILPDYFANGGDVTADNCRELDVCRKLGIQTIFGVGGSEKVQSSSTILGNLANQDRCIHLSPTQP